MIKQTRIIAAFPGSGKSTVHATGRYSSADSDSSQFSWSVDAAGVKLRNPDWPANYMAHIKEQIGQVDFIFVSTHKEVRDALLRECLFFYLVYPVADLKEEYVARYRQRNSPQAFITLLDNQFDTWVRECAFCARGCKQITMWQPNSYLDKELRHIVASENGER